MAKTKEAAVAVEDDPADVKPEAASPAALLTGKDGLTANQNEMLDLFEAVGKVVDDNAPELMRLAAEVKKLFAAKHRGIQIRGCTTFDQYVEKIFRTSPRTMRSWLAKAGKTDRRFANKKPKALPPRGHVILAGAEHGFEGVEKRTEEGIGTGVAVVVGGVPVTEWQPRHGITPEEEAISMAADIDMAQVAAAAKLTSGKVDDPKLTRRERNILVLAADAQIEEEIPLRVKPTPVQAETATETFYAIRRIGDGCLWTGYAFRHPDEGIDAHDVITYPGPDSRLFDLKSRTSAIWDIRKKFNREHKLDKAKPKFDPAGYGWVRVEAFYTLTPLT